MSDGLNDQNSSVVKEDKIAILQEMLNHIKSENPRFRSIMRREIALAHQKSKENQEKKEIIRRLRIQNNKLLRQLLILKDHIEQSKTEKNEIQTQLKQLTRFNNSLSAALGACNKCWGEDADCVQCSGEGSSGSLPINRRLFNRYVYAALVELKKTKEINTSNCIKE